MERKMCCQWTQFSLLIYESFEKALLQVFSFFPGSLRKSCSKLMGPKELL